jgi:hypothetical protein
MGIISNERCSSTIQICARILIGALDSGDLLGWENRCSVLQSHIQQLAALRWVAGTGWAEFFANWEGLAMETVQGIFSQFKGQSGIPPPIL